MKSLYLQSPGDTAGLSGTLPSSANLDTSTGTASLRPELRRESLTNEVMSSRATQDHSWTECSVSTDSQLLKAVADSVNRDEKDTRMNSVTRSGDRIALVTQAFTMTDEGGVQALSFGATLSGGKLTVFSDEGSPVAARAQRELSSDRRNGQEWNNDPVHQLSRLVQSAIAITQDSLSTIEKNVSALTASVVKEGAADEGTKQRLSQCSTQMNALFTSTKEMRDQVELLVKELNAGDEKHAKQFELLSLRYSQLLENLKNQKAITDSSFATLSTNSSSRWSRQMGIFATIVGVGAGAFGGINAITSSGPNYAVGALAITLMGILGAMAWKK